MPKLVITESTKIVSFKIDGAPVVVNQEYDLSLQDTIEIENIFGYPSEPLDFFKYKITDTNATSINEALVKIGFVVDTSTLPEEYNLIQTLSIYESFLFTDLVPPANNYDRIKINSIEGKGLWAIDGVPIEPGQILFFYQILNKLSFTASDTGSKEHYNLLKFQFGHKLGYWSHENSIDVNAISLAEINLINPVAVPEMEESIEILEYETNILNGPQLGTYNLKIDTTEFVNIGSPASNRIVVIEDEVETVYNTSGIFDYSSILSVSGSTVINFRIEKQYPYPDNSSISITLDEINENSSGIDPLKNNIILDVPESIIS